MMQCADSSETAKNCTRSLCNVHGRISVT